MANYLKPTQSSTPKAKAPKRLMLDRMVADQDVADLPFMEEAQVGAGSFQECIAILYGPPGAGKTAIACQVPGHYLIDSENKSQWQKRRATYVPNWVSLRAFTDKMEKRPELVATVQMWVIDTIDVLVDKGISTVCLDRGITDLSDEGFARAWQDLKSEVIYQVLRLRALGPGVLLVSHEREIEIKRRHLQMTHTRMDLSKSIFNAISFLADMTMHLTYTVKDTIAGDINAERCLVFRGNEDEDAKNCTTADLPARMPFKTEDEAVQRILSAFSGEPRMAERSSPTKKKVVKKVKKKVKKKVVKRS